jgi:hypothetical protein
MNDFGRAHNLSTEKDLALQHPIFETVNVLNCQMSMKDEFKAARTQEVGYRRARNQFHQFVLFDCFSTSIFINARPNVASGFSLPFSYSTVIDGLVQM